MKLNTEIIEEKQKALIIAKTDYLFIDNLKSHLKRFSVDHFFSSLEPKSFKIFDYIFIIDSHISLTKIQENENKKFIFIFLKKKTHSSLLHSRVKNVKIVEINNSHLDEADIDKILWFAFSDTNEKLLKLNFLIKKEKPFLIKKPGIIKPHLTKNNLVISLIFVVIAFHLLFLPFSLLSSFFVYRSFSSLKKENMKSAVINISKASSLNNIAKSLYSLSKPTYRLFAISTLPDNLIEINTNSISAVEETQSVLTNAKEIQSLIFMKNKSELEKENIKLRFQKLDSSLDELTQNIIVINQKLDFPFKSIKTIRNNLLETSDLLSKSRKLLGYFEKIISFDEPTKYLIFFANNMELRPGGGFIGSFAVIDLKNYEIGELKVYDVYDADGQLTAHIDPPKPIAEYLNMPHWFLRDSNFSPDFLENYEKALFFLEKELALTDFDGSILLTTTAVENILTAFNDIYIPDYNETINAKNFYLKTQFHVEKNFFPGSTQKQVFLSKIVQQILINFENVDSAKLLLAIKKSLDEKQIAVYLNDETTQALFDSSFWSGRVIEPKCLTGSDCIIDYLFPYDANVGANKANFFVNRSMYLKTITDSSGVINHQLMIRYENSSPSEIFPTGYYRNYFQILLPNNSIIKNITKDGVLVEDFDQKDDKFKLIGFFFEIAPKKVTEIKINYQLGDTIKRGKQIYQLIFQKQIGAHNSDLILDFRFNKNISLVNQNFSPLVKDDQIIYNTNLSTDKIFFIELLNNN